MKITIVGAGAIGGYVGVKLALAGEQVSVIARGANLAAIRSRGLKLILNDGTELVAQDVAATADCAALGPQDIVVLAVKAHQVEGVANDIPALFGPETVVVTMQNGIPYWYFHAYGGPLEGRCLRVRRSRRRVPAGKFRQRASSAAWCIPPPCSKRQESSVTSKASASPSANLNGSLSARVQAVSECFTRAGFKAPVLDNIRAEIWLKLWGNLTFNPISALTRATLVDICQFSPTRTSPRR